MLTLLHSSLDSSSPLYIFFFASSKVELLGASLPNLQELCLDGSQLASLRDLGTALANLTSLSLADCGLDELDGVAAMPSLRSLRLPGNRIDDLTPLCTHDCLQVLLKKLISTWKASSFP